MSPIDPRIPLMIQPPASPIEGYLAGQQAAQRQLLIQSELQQRQMEVQAQQRQLAAQDALDRAFAGATTVDPQTGQPTIDEGKLFANVPGHLRPALMESFNKFKASAADLQDKQAKAEIAKNNLLGDMAATVKASGYDPQTFLQAIKGAQANKWIDPQRATQIAMQAIEDPSSVQRMTDQYLAGSEERAKLGTTLQAAQLRAGGDKINKEALALKAAQGDETAAAALKLLSGSEKPTAELAAERYEGIQANLLQKKPVSTEDLAWAKAYERQKTLGPEASAAAAGERQAVAIGAQVAQQARAQNFQEAQAGRKELQDKVEQPYLDAREKAETLRNVIAAAKSGNMAAGNVQTLLGTLGLVTMEGVKRINTTELQQVGGAGSLLERIKGEVSGLTRGQPLSAKVQKDLGELANILEQSARTKYERGFSATKQRYGGLQNEQMIPPPAPTSEVATANPFRKPQ